MFCQILINDYMKKIIKFFEINLSAVLVIMVMIIFIVIEVNNISPKIPQLLKITLHFCSLFLLLLQFFIWKENDMLNKDLLSFFIALLIANISIITLILMPSGNDLLGYFLTLGTISIIAILFSFIKVFIWFLSFLFRKSK